MLPIGGGQFLIYEEEAPATDAESVPDTFSFGRIGKKRRHKIEV